MEIKNRSIRSLSDKELIKLKRELEFDLVKVRTGGNIKEKEKGYKKISKPGEKTSIQKNIKRSIAKIKTELKIREIKN